ncbi:methionine synthase (B12-independent) [Desulfurella multipotens]|uniref:5-methyltetrahydropteroyltriglutamate--homocysteine S-methyltransferase n=1 Tax=Desulfurella multipotens TaxID=79269 RepID=A0A1G6P6Z1_9BACT|nr:5-methyltetrahydropteroyltriglutamate--homocysteine S-methyltransferase [Desulfurella multipotens]SDC75384.1 methionine synthase (B12-independent) [Desulfurella multipotens]
MFRTTASYFPRIGLKREYKQNLESYWEKKISKEEFVSNMQEIQKHRLDVYSKSGLDYIVCNDFTYYDFMLDLSFMFGCIPERFSHIQDELDLYFAMARGDSKAQAQEMTKWFDTNYHYIVPEFDGHFELKNNTVLKNWLEDKKLGYDTTPVIIGPFTFISLGKINDNNKWLKPSQTKEFRSLLLNVAKQYNTLLIQLQENGVRRICFDEPAFVLDYDKSFLKDIFDAYEIVKKNIFLDITLNSYYESLSYFNEIIENINFDTLGLDFTFRENVENVIKFGLPKDKKLQIGLIGTRHPFKDNLNEAKQLIGLVQKKLSLSSDQMILSTAGPLMHLPVSLELENFDPKISNKLLFSKEKLQHLNLLKNILNGRSDYDFSDEQLEKDENYEETLLTIKKLNPKRAHPFKLRYIEQVKSLNLPKFPTTTIGSFPQTKELRQKRSQFISGKISESEYNQYINDQIKYIVKLQEDLGIDVLVHGEFERSDMVEFFAQKLEGFLCTKHGWVISYGSRAIRPPIIYGKVKRTKPMTIKEIVYAQSLTKKPLKGMLTGPITILNWSFTRPNVPKEVIAYEIALALKEEVMDLQKANIKIIQIDEPAFREGLPLKESKKKDYLEFASKIFRFVVEDVDKLTQIHTHMCYSEFDEIVNYIYEMDADCISIEASRSKGDIISSFEKFKYDHAIGLGVWDIHSPRVPSVEEMLEIAERSFMYIDKNLFWINPDCGLKTRKYEEVIPSLKNMIEAAKILRKKYGEKIEGVL